MAITFDTLKYSEKLQEVGFTPEQAKVQVETLAEIIDENLATKQGIALIQRDIKELEVALKRDIKEIEQRLTIRLGGMLVVGIGEVATLMKLL